MPFPSPIFVPGACAQDPSRGLQPSPAGIQGTAPETAQVLQRHLQRLVLFSPHRQRELTPLSPAASWR